MHQGLCYVVSTSWLNFYSGSLPTEEDPARAQKFLMEI